MRINFKRAIGTAYNAIEVHEIVDFPINLHEVFDDYDNLTVISYGHIMKQTGMNRGEVIISNCSSEGSIAYDASSNQYIIAYNELADIERPKERIYWTLAHEFGHYLMQHNKDKKAARLSRLNLDSSDYDAYEAEADFFARFFLNPPTIINKAKMMSVERIMSFFGVTRTAASKTFKYIENQISMGWSLTPPRKIVNQLSFFIKKLNKGQTCRRCNTFFCYDAVYCPICGSSELHNFIKGDDFRMKYPVIEMDDFYRVIQCPNCNNENIRGGNYCQICGAYLVNKCTGFSVNDLDHQYTGRWHELERGCGELLNGDARFCTKCGSTSIFYETGLLKSWKDEIEQEEIADSSDILPF